MTMVAAIVEVEMGDGSYCAPSIIVVSRIGPGRCAGHNTHDRSRKLL